MVLCLSTFSLQAVMRKTWLEENQRLVAVDNFGNDLAAVEAAQKKHEAIETDIMVSTFTLQVTMFLHQNRKSVVYYRIKLC